MGFVGGGTIELAPCFEMTKENLSRIVIINLPKEFIEKSMFTTISFHRVDKNKQL